MEYYNQVIETAFGNWEIRADKRYILQILHLDKPTTVEVRPNSITQACYLQLEEYFKGDRMIFDLPLDKNAGTPFQREVWDQVSSIPYGETTNYQKIANLMDNPGSVRAVGAANGKNPLPLVIPCHRVIGSDGSLTGYAYGVPLKKQLLLFEKAISPDLFD